ncbi:hypothetical protein PIB30_023882 [Stylosanthes scabra]|uniref:Uncharacterized protein n=1 Tax=Stylosanthes scabra TaxID=79078 RepID=A0ABU6T9U0_9FABA|nr:hypothetical protein [Stylosanthes scabra]
MAGRLVRSLEDSNRFEIECNDAGIVVIAARTNRKLSEFGVVFLTQFGCGSLALTTHYNHCTLDGLAVRDFEANLAALTRGDPLTIQIESFKRKALKDCKLKNVTSFYVVAAKIWKARTIAMNMLDDTMSTMLFPVDARKKSKALVPGFARATVKELIESEDGYDIRKVQEGIERLDDEYIKSGIDWLELNRGVPCWEDSFSFVSWLRLELEDQTFAWGQLKCSTPLTVKSGLIILLPGPPGDGGINICLDLPQNQMYMFCRIMLEEI